MNDANGRPIELNDYVTLTGAGVSIVSQVIEMFDDDGNGFVHLDDGLVFHDFEVESWGGFEWIRCQLCDGTWPLDTRMNNEECPFCEAPSISEMEEMEWDVEMALHGGQLAEF